MRPSAPPVASALSDGPRATPAPAARLGRLAAAVAIACALPWPAQAQAPEGGLYIAGYGFGFVKAAQQAMAQNPPGRRFFVLALPPNTDALTRRAPRSTVAVRDRAVARGGVLLVCQRDLDSGAVRAADLVPGVVAVRGFPPPGSADIAHGERYFAGEDSSRLPQSNTALRRARSTCS